eukprot:gene5050-8757_t
MTTFEDFRNEYTKAFDLDDAKQFNRLLAQFVTDQKVRTFVHALYKLCNTPEKENLIPIITNVLPQNVQISFSNAWMLAKEGKLSEQSTARLNIHRQQDVLHSFDVLYLGAGGMPHIPNEANPQDLQLLNSILQGLLESDSAAQPSFMEITKDTVRVLDDADDDVINQLALDHIVFCQTMQVNGEGEMDVIVFVQQDPIYELVVAQFMMLNVHEASRAIQAIQGSPTSKTDMMPDNNPFYASDDIGDTLDEQPALESIECLELDRSNLNHVSRIGAGQFGMVYLADYKSDETSQRVAVKLLRTDCAASEKLDFKHEAFVMFKLKHPHIVEIIGVCMQKAPWLLVLEYMPFGNMRSFLQNCLRKNFQLSVCELYSCCRQLASALEYMHSKGYVHMDIAARNVLLGHNATIKLADFGQAQIKDQNGEFILQTVMRLSVRWMAPETLSNFRKVFSERTDIWAYAVTCWEFFMYGRLPFKSLTTEVARDMIKAGKARLVSRPPVTCPKNMWVLLSACWDYEPEKRPTFIQLKEEIERLEEACTDGPCRDLGKFLSEIS